MPSFYQTLLKFSSTFSFYHGSAKFHISAYSLGVCARILQLIYLLPKHIIWSPLICVVPNIYPIFLTLQGKHRYLHNSQLCYLCQIQPQFLLCRLCPLKLFLNSALVVGDNLKEEIRMF
jgi:hypothetical protein